MKLPNKSIYKVTAVEVPVESAVSRVYASADLADAFRVTLPADASHDPEQLARFMFSTQPGWVNALMWVRDAIVGPLRLKTGAQLVALGAHEGSTRVGLFKVYSKDASEIVLGEDDAHLDFRVAVRCSSDPDMREERYLTVATVVRCHNALGRAYIFLIAPFHRIVVRSTLGRAMHLGWPPHLPANHPGTR